MADHKVHDGRFGESFDDEVNIPSVVWITIGVAVIVVLGFIISWWLEKEVFERPAAPPASVPAVARTAEPRLPPGPLLQASPEEELRELRAEMHELLTSYGWADRSRGTVRIPVDKAIDLVLERGLSGAAAPAGSDGSDGSDESEANTP